jgi:dTDP-4-amino-4,6-dideoxygalactose transaminase
MYRGLPSAQRDNLPIATAASQQVLCLPIYPDLSSGDVEEICAIIATI